MKKLTENQRPRYQKGGEIKTLTLFFLLGTLAANAQTNLITFIDGAGILRQAVPTYKLGENILVYRTAAGGGTVKLSTLPPAIQAQFGYDAAAATLADQLQAQRQAAFLVQRQAALERQSQTASARIAALNAAGNSAASDAGNNPVQKSESDPASQSAPGVQASDVYRGGSPQPVPKSFGGHRKILTSIHH